MTPSDLLPLLRVEPSKIASRVLVVGDPARARRAAESLDAVERVGDNREYSTFTGRLGDTRITVASHGVGSAGAGVCFEELMRAGAKVLIRAGTCGALCDSISDGDMIVVTGAVRDEGLTPRLVPLSYPALAHHDLVAALLDAADGAGQNVHQGLMLTSDLFYPSEALGQEFGLWQRSRVIGVEMELAALFVLASLHGARAGGIAVVDGNPTRAAQDMSEYDPYRRVVSDATDVMIGLALETLARVEA
ncbi:MAG: nucleoside phosphorylase [Acidobacteriota bacterium]